MNTDGNKATGPDDFMFKFAHFFWPELKREVFNMFNNFFETTEFEHRFSSSFILLISKVSFPSNLNDFRLISLLKWVHKLVTRVLVDRLRRVMRKLVRDSQSTFIKGRSIFK